MPAGKSTVMSDNTEVVPKLLATPLAVMTAALMGVTSGWSVVARLSTQ